MHHFNVIYFHILWVLYFWLSFGARHFFIYLLLKKVLSVVVFLPLLFRLSVKAIVQFPTMERYNGKWPKIKWPQEKYNCVSWACHASITLSWNASANFLSLMHLTAMLQIIWCKLHASVHKSSEPITDTHTWTKNTQTSEYDWIDRLPKLRAQKTQFTRSYHDL